MVKDMTKGSPMKLILGFAIPMLMGMLFQQSPMPVLKIRDEEQTEDEIQAVFVNLPQNRRIGLFSCGGKQGASGDFKEGFRTIGTINNLTQIFF